MYTLYYAPGSASMAVHWLLLELGVPFELAKVDLAGGQQRSAEYLRMNPNGRVPTLVVDGAARAETAALLMLLAERHPEGGFAPATGAPERAEWMQQMVFLANTLMPAFRTWFYPEEPAGAGGADASQAAARARIEAVWDRMDETLADGRTWLVGSRMSTADLLLTMLTRWSRNMPRRAEAWPHLAAYVGRMRALPSLREVHAREGLTEWIDG